MPDYRLINENAPIAGSLKNIGNNNVISFQGEYRINGVVSETFSISGIEISPFETYSFIAGEPAVFSSVGIFAVELIINKVNGEDDHSPENNMQIHDISIASATVARKPLFEMFTSSSCCPCVEGNEAVDGVLRNNPDTSFSLVKYQTDWPGIGDPYYNEDCGIRVDYYNIGGVPNLMINGKD